MDLRKRDQEKPLPNWMIKMLALSKGNKLVGFVLSSTKRTGKQTNKSSALIKLNSSPVIIAIIVTTIG
jgi:predicted ribosome quality control (RQC) complex YloA/Tae2 family protein